MLLTFWGRIVVYGTFHLYLDFLDVVLEPFQRERSGENGPHQGQPAATKNRPTVGIAVASFHLSCFQSNFLPKLRKQRDKIKARSTIDRDGLRSPALSRDFQRPFQPYDPVFLWLSARRAPLKATISLQITKNWWKLQICGWLAGWIVSVRLRRTGLLSFKGCPHKSFDPVHIVKSSQKGQIVDSEFWSMGRWGHFSYPLTAVANRCFLAGYFLSLWLGVPLPTGCSLRREGKLAAVLRVEKGLWGQLWGEAVMRHF